MYEAYLISFGVTAGRQVIYCDCSDISLLLKLEVALISTNYSRIGLQIGFLQP